MTAKEQQAGAVMLCAISPFVIGIVARDDYGQPGRLLGTGTGLQFGDSSLILTADHTLRNSSLDDLFFIPPPSDGFRFSKSRSQTQYQARKKWDAIKIVREPRLDIAAVIAREPPEVRFFRLDEGSSTPGKGRQVAICGYPVAKAEPIQRGAEIGYSASADFQGATTMDSASVDGLKPFQFAIDYPTPSGYSGAMIWYDEAGSRTLDELRQRLTLGAAGIVTDHSPTHQALVCTRIEDIVRFLKDALLSSCALILRP